MPIARSKAAAIRRAPEGNFDRWSPRCQQSRRRGGSISQRPAGLTERLVLICPPGAELAPVSHGGEAFEVYRERQHGGLWLVDVPIEAAGPLMRVGGFRLYQPPAAAPE